MEDITNQEYLELISEGNALSHVIINDNDGESIIKVSGPTDIIRDDKIVHVYIGRQGIRNYDYLSEWDYGVDGIISRTYKF